MADDLALRIRFVLQQSEFTRASALVTRSLPAKVRWPAWVQCLLLLVLAVIPLVVAPQASIASLSGFVVLWLALAMGPVSVRGLRNYQFGRMEGRELWYEFGETEFRCGMAGGESRVEWSSLRGFVEASNLFVILQRGLFYTIPKRALSAEETNQLRELLKSKLTSL